MTPRQKALEDLLDTCRDLREVNDWSETHLEIIKQVEAFDKISPDKKTKPVVVSKSVEAKTFWVREIVFAICYSILVTLPMILMTFFTLFGS